MEDANPAIPPSLALEGYHHVGDPAYFNGTLILPVEDRGFEAPLLLVVAAGNLKPLSSFILPDAQHLPWVAVRVDKDASTAELFYSESRNVSKISRRTYPDLVEQPSLALSAAIQGVQGGVFDDRGVLHVSAWIPGYPLWSCVQSTSVRGRAQLISTRLLGQIFTGATCTNSMSRMDCSRHTSSLRGSELPALWSWRVLP